MRQQLHRLNKRGQDSYAKRFGISIEPLALQPLSPALDLLLSNPPDPTHSEYSGITRLMHEILLDNILTPLAVRIYHLQLRQFPFPPGYARLQSPIHHLKSYNMSDYARWSMVIAPLLRVWLRVNHIKPNSIRALRSNFGPSRTNPNDTEAVNEIVQAFASLAKSNNMLMGRPTIKRDRGQMLSVIKQCRNSYQSLVNCAAFSLDMNSRSQAATLEVAEMNSRTQSSKAGKIMIKKKALPNVHIALHYPDIAEEYGLLLMVNTLIVESKHKFFKEVVYRTNYSNIEKIMLQKENFRQTVRLLLLDAFRHTDRPLTLLIQSLQMDCPLLFKTLLARSEIDNFHEIKEDYLFLEGDDNYLRSSVIGRLKQSDIVTNLNLPIRANDNRMPAWFQTLL